MSRSENALDRSSSRSGMPRPWKARRKTFAVSSKPIGTRPQSLPNGSKTISPRASSSSRFPNITGDACGPQTPSSAPFSKRSNDALKRFVSFRTKLHSNALSAPSSSKLMTSGPLPTSPTLNGKTRMTDHRKSEFPDNKLLNPAYCVVGSRTPFPLQRKQRC
jgi:hypothetical protein